MLVRVAHLRFSTFDLLEYVRFTQAVVDLNTYRESSHLGSLPLVEMVALALTARPAVVAGDGSRFRPSAPS